MNNVMPDSSAIISDLREEVKRLQKINGKLRYVLIIARDRAVRHGDRLVQLGNPDINRGQFLSVVNIALAESECAQQKLKEKQ